MTIKLGLERMRTLYGQHHPTWQSIHVAGTNGKGSVCSYLTALLSRHGVSHGRFTSPIMRRPEDSILINNEPISTELFRSFYESAGETTREDIASHFERMTYAAFKAFDHFGVRYGVVETGLGGRLDATNILQNKAVTVITKIGLDHQEYLGNTIEEIAAEKGAIMRSGIPCIINHRSLPEAVDVLLNMAKEIGSKPVLTNSKPADELSKAVIQRGAFQRWPEHMVDNALCAVLALTQLEEFRPEDVLRTLDALPASPLEGRLQPVDISQTPLGKKYGRSQPLILDGAHNMDACRALEKHTSSQLRASSTDPIVWVIAMSKPREEQAAEMLSFIKAQDSVVFTEYEFVDTRQDHPTYEHLSVAFRPRPLGGADLQHIQARTGTKLQLAPILQHSLAEALEDAVRLGSQRAQESSASQELPVVVTGSLYLVGDVLRRAEEITARGS